MAGKIAVVGYDLMDTTRAALLDGALTLVIAHPMARMGEVAISGMIRASSQRTETANYTSILPFEIYTRENI